MLNLGTVRPGSTIYIPFDTFAGSTGASVTASGLAVGDIKIYKAGSTTERASTSGFTLLDTDGIDFDTLTGLHGFSIDLSDNTTSGFYTCGSRFMVAVSSITVDSQTVSFWIATFDIGYPGAIINTTIATLASQTSFTLTNAPAEASALVGCPVIIHDIASGVQLGHAVISAYAVTTKTVTLSAATTFTAAAGDNISIFPPSNARWIGNALPSAATIGTVSSVTAVATGGITAASIAADAIGASELAADAATEIATAVWAAATRQLTGSQTFNLTGDITGNLSGSVGSVTADVSTALDDLVIRTGTAQTGSTSTTLVLDASASASNNFYNGSTVVITGGTGAGQVRGIKDYVGSTKVATVNTWTTTPDNTSTFMIFATAEMVNANLLELNYDAPTVSGLGSLGTDYSSNGFVESRVNAMLSNTITSSALATTAVDEIRDAILADSTPFNGASIAAILADTGTDIPSSIAALPTAADNADAVWDEAKAGHVGAGSFGEEVQAHALSSEIGALNDLSAAEVNAEVDAALADYDPPTRAELTTDTNSILTRLGTPAGADVSADIAAVKAETAAIIVDTGTDIPALLADIQGATFDTATDSLEAIRNRGDAAWTTGGGGTNPILLQNTTIATLASQTSFTLTAGSADNDAYNNAIIIITDQSTSTQKAVGYISDYVGSTKTVTLAADPAIFTMAVGDTVDIVAAHALLATIVADTNELQTNQGDWATATGFSTHSAADVRTEMDSNSTQLAAILADTGTDIPALIGALNDLSAAQVNAEVDTALGDYDGPTLDELVGLFQLAMRSDSAVETDRAALLTLVNANEGSGAGDYSAITDSLEASQAEHDQTQTDISGISAGTNPTLLQTTTIATLASQTSFTLTAGSADDDAYNSQIIVVVDQSTSTQKAVGIILDYTGSSKTVTLDGDPGIFTMAVGDTVHIIATSPAASAPSAAAIADAVLAEAIADHSGTAGSLAEFISDTLTDTSTTIPAQISGLENLSAAEVNAEVDAALADYDPPTRAELTTDIGTVTTAISALNDPSAAAIADAVWDEVMSGHSTAGTTGAEMQSHATTSEVSTLLSLSQPMQIASTTIGTVNSQTNFTLSGGPTDDDILNNSMIIITSALSSSNKFPVRITDFVGATRTVTIETAPPFTLAGGETVTVWAKIGSSLTAAEIRAEMDSNSTQLAAIVADTNELQTNQGDWATATGFSTHSAADVRTEMDSNSTQLAAIVADTNEIQTDLANGGRLDLIFDAILADTAELQTDDIPGLIAALNDVAATDIVSGGAITTSGGAVSTVTNVTNQVTANMTSISGSATAADNLEASALVIITGTAQTGTLSTTQMSTNLSEATDDHYIGRVIIWTSGNLLGQASDITDYAGTNGVLTFSALTEAPQNGDTFVIV